jgi:hypothetical protein
MFPIHGEKDLVSNERDEVIEFLYKHVNVMFLFLVPSIFSTLPPYSIHAADCT